MSPSPATRSEPGGERSRPDDSALTGWPGRIRTGGLLAGRGDLLSIAAVVVLACLVLGVGSQLDIYVGGLVAVYAIAAISQDWLIGRSGLVSFGGAAMMAVGAFTTTATAGRSWLPFPLPVLAAALVGGAVGLVIGLPSLRLRGLYLVISSLALQYVVQFIGQGYQDSSPAGLIAPVPSLAGLRLSTYRESTTLTVMILVIVMIAMAGLQRGPTGRAWRAVMHGDIAAAVVGVPVTRWKLSAFVGSSAMCAVAGSLFAYYLGVVSYETFDLNLAISLILMVYLGGAGTLIGPVVGALLVVLFPYAIDDLTALLNSGWLSTNAPSVETAAYGAVLALVILLEPRGLAGLLARLGGLTRRLAGRHPDPAQPKVQPVTEPSVAEPSLAAPLLPGMSARPAASSAMTAAGADAVLSVRDLSVRYATGAIGADHVSFDVPARSIVALVGRNGAGKTSVLRGICGFVPGESATRTGSVRLGGRNLAGLSSYRVARQGVALVSERDKVFPSLTVAQHFGIAKRASHSEAAVLNRFPRLKERWQAPAGLLSGGERQMLAIAVAWRTAPRLLIVDELSLGLAPKVASDLFTLLRELCQEWEMSALVVEQDARAAVVMSDLIYVLDQGSVVWSAASADVDAEMLTSTYLSSR